MSMSQENAGTINPTVTTLRNVMGHCKQNFVETWKYCQTDEERQHLKIRAEVIMLKLIRDELIQLESTLEEIDFVEPATDAKIEESLTIFEQACEQKRQNLEAKITTNKMKQHPEYVALIAIVNKAFQELLKEDSNTQDLNDSQMADVNTSEVSEAIPTMDPITKLPLTDPIRNRLCKHIYGKSAILALLKKNKKIRCPQMGCANRNYLKLEDLKEDPFLAEKIRKQTLRSQQYKASQSQKQKNQGNTTTELE